MHFAGNRTRRRRPAPRALTLVLVVVALVAGSARGGDQGDSVAELERRLAGATGVERVKVLNDLAYATAFTSVATARRYGEEALALAEKLGDRQQQARALRHLAVASSVAGEQRTALELAQRALALFEQVGDRKGASVAYNTIGICFRMLDDYPAALASYEKSLAIDRELGDERGVARTLGNVATVHYDRGEYGAALEANQEVLAIRRRLGDRKELPGSLNNLGITLYRMGAYDQALEYLLESQRIDEELGNLNGVAESSANIGNIFQEMGQLDRALEYFQRGLELFTRVGNQSGVLEAHAAIGNVYQLKSRYDDALGQFTEALEIARRAGIPGSVASSLDSIGGLRRAQGQYQVALDLHREALAIRERIGDQEGVVRSCENIGNALLGLGGGGEARPFLERALALAQSIRSVRSVQEIGDDLATLYSSSGDFEKAFRSFKLSAEARDTLLNDQTNRRIAELEARYRSEAKAREIALLQKENEIRRLEASRARLRSNLVLVVLAVVLAVVALLARRYRYLFTFWKRRSFIGHYRIVAQIAAGGMGVVYRAENVMEGSRTFALKVIRDEHAADDAVRRRFLHEAAVVDQLDHPHVVKVHERGEHDGRLFMAMELLEGSSLAEVIHRGERLAVADCLHVMAQLAEVVASIHAKGILHRDLKPENILLVEREGDPRFVKLLDFGLARTQSLTRLTETGTIVGTLAYLPPEQITEQRFTAAGDVYALGVIFYELLTLQPAFPGETPVDIIRQILGAEPVRPLLYRAEIGPELDALVLAMVAKDPTARPADDEVCTRLAEIADAGRVGELKADS